MCHYRWWAPAAMAMLHGCTVGDNTLLGIGCVVLNRAVIGRNCIVGVSPSIRSNLLDEVGRIGWLLDLPSENKL